MNVREALEAIRGTRYCDHEGFDNRCHNCTAWLVKGEVFADLAPVIERALDAAIDSITAEHFGEMPKYIHRWRAAFVAAMVEGL